MMETTPVLFEVVDDRGVALLQARAKVAWYRYLLARVELDGVPEVVPFLMALCRRKLHKWKGIERELLQHGMRRVRAVSKSNLRIYSVKLGDTLSGIACDYLGDAGRWPEIACLSGLGKSTEIYPGQQLLLPPAR